jgi:hypothetical protein
MSTLSVGTIQSNTTSPPTINNSAGTAIGTFCRAWVNFNASSGTPTISASFNVSSLGDNGLGNYTVNIDIDMPDANYAAVASSRSGATGTGNAYAAGVSDLAAGSFRISTTGDGSSASTLVDSAIVSAAVFR